MTAGGERSGGTTTEHSDLNDTSWDAVLAASEPGRPAGAPATAVVSSGQGRLERKARPGRVGVVLGAQETKKSKKKKEAASVQFREGRWQGQAVSLELGW